MKEEDTNMEIKRPAIAGTLESSDCQVMVEAGEGKIDLSLDSAVINQYGNQIRKVVLETLFFGLMPILISIAGEFGVEATHIAIVMVVCRNCATFISLVVSATFLGVGLAGVEIKDHIKKCFFWIWGCQHYLSDIRTDPGCDQIIDIINYIVIPHKVLPLQDLRVLVLQKGIGLDGPVPSLCVLWV